MKTTAMMTLASILFMSAPLWATDPALEKMAKRRGQEVLRSVSADIDGDGHKEVVAGVLVDYGVALTVWRKVGENPYRLLYTSRVYDGQVVLRLAAKHLVADAKPEVIFEVREVTPDETSRHLIVTRFVDGKLVPIFDTVFPVEDIRPAREGEEVLAFGETAAGYRFVDPEKDGQMELAVRRAVKTMKAKKPDRSKLVVIVGSQETIYKFNAKSGKAGSYTPGREKFHSYLTTHKPAKVSGSSQALPAHLESKFGRAAVEEGMKDVFSGVSGDSTEAEVDAGPEGPDGGEEMLVRDPAPMAKWASDGDMDTSWCEGVDGEGQGEWWQADFGGTTTFRMMRLVFGDVRSQKAFYRRNEVTGVTLIFSSGDRVFFDRKDSSFAGGKLAGYADFPLEEGRPGLQTMVFFSRPIAATWVRVELSSVKSRGAADESCITEAYFYGPRKEKAKKKK